MTVLLLLLVVFLIILLLVQPMLLKSRQAREILELQELVKKLTADCAEATARAERYEEDFQRELNRISILLTKML